MNVTHIARKIESDWKNFRDGKKRIAQGRKSGTEVKKYMSLAKLADNLYDVAAKTTARKTVCKKEWGVDMSDKEVAYLEDQRTSRLQECDDGTDAVWWSGEQRRLKREQIKQKWDEEKKEQFSSVASGSLDVNTSDEECENMATVDSEKECQIETSPGSPSKGKRRKFSASESDINELDELPDYMRHIRSSERLVRDDIYECLADLVGYGLSLTGGNEIPC